jgi:NifB/MoaA-like Fe-S oxidoreductase
LEDGVGLVRLFLDDLEQVKRTLPRKRWTRPRSFTLVTGEMPAPLVRQLADVMNRVDGLTVNVCAVHNYFFEGNIQVAGLLTGADIARALSAPDFPLNDTVIVPNVLLRDGDDRVMIDDMTLGGSPNVSPPRLRRGPNALRRRRPDAR